LRFFQRIAIAFEREAFALECLTERFDPAWQRFSVNDLHALSDLRKAQRLGSRHLKGRGDHGVGQRWRTATVMATHQTAHTTVAPCVGPVVDALSAHTELFGNHLGLDPAPEHQQPRSSRARIPVFVIDRQLPQCHFLGFAQFYNTLHPLPRHHEGARIAKFKSIDQEHLQALSGPIESDGVMMAFTYVNANEEVDGVMLLVFLHREVFMQIELVGLQHRWQVSASTLRTASRCSRPSPFYEQDVVKAFRKLDRDPVCGGARS
jgi:hypothetical protein